MERKSAEPRSVSRINFWRAAGSRSDCGEIPGTKFLETVTRVTEKELTKVSRMTHALNKLAAEMAEGRVSLAATMARNVQEGAQAGAEILQGYRENCEVKLSFAEDMEAKSKASDWEQGELFDQNGSPLSPADENGKILHFPGRLQEPPREGMDPAPEGVDPSKDPLLNFTQVPLRVGRMLAEAIHSGKGKTAAMASVTDLGGVPIKSVMGWWLQMEKAGYVYKDAVSKKWAAKPIEQTDPTDDVAIEDDQLPGDEAASEEGAEVKWRIPG